MRQAILVLLLGFAAHARAEFALDVRMIARPTKDMLRERCEGREACTRFVAERLDGHCVPRENAWSIEASASAVALVYAIGSGREAHEMLHIIDMRKNVKMFLRSIQEVRFEREDLCRANVEAAVSNFRGTMMNFARASVAKRN